MAGAVFDKRLSEMATAVCAKDSRTIAQRRADALSALCEGRTLACDCGQPDCAARAHASESAAGGVQTVINVIATEATVTGDSDQPGYLEGYGVIDAEQVRELADTATIRPVECPTVSEDEALRYQPSAALERWIRCRDMTCRFPGCDRKAAICDLDHTTPFNQADPSLGGLTVPWDLACYCREHHRLKTFHGGLGGWRDEQLPDGTIVWTSPTGRVYKTTPDGYDLFPQLREAVGHRHRASAADPKSRLSGLLVPAARCASSAQSMPKPGGSTTHARGKSNCADGVTSHAGC